MAKWKKVPPYKGSIHQGCFNCPPVIEKADLKMIIAVGFGKPEVTKDGEVIYSEPLEWEIDKGIKSEKDIKTLAEIEKEAQKDPDHDYRCILDAPLRSREYQRHGKNNWVLISSGRGFA
jgi:hypothetical protein